MTDDIAERLSELADAIEYDQSDRVEALLAEGVPPDAKVWDDWPLLCWALQNASHGSALHLLDHGVPVNSQCPCEADDDDIEGGYAPDVFDGQGQGDFALHQAACRGYVDILKRLLDAGVDLETRNGLGKTAIQRAAEAGQPDAVSLLLDRGASVEVRTPGQQRSLLHLAAVSGLTDISDRLCASGLSIRDADVKGVIPPMSAAGRGHDALACHYLDRDPDLRSYRTPKGLGVIHAASAGGAVETIKRLHSLGADFTDIGNPIAFAKNSRVVRALLDAGFSLADDPASRERVLGLALGEDDIELLDTSWRAGPPDSDQARAALERGVALGSARSVRHLLGRGVETDLNSALGQACVLHVEAAIARLEARGGNIDAGTLAEEVLSGHEGVITALIDAGARPDLPDGDGGNALTCVCDPEAWRGYNELGDTLGKDWIRFPESIGRHPTFTALVRRLLELGFDPNTTKKGYKHPVYAAAASRANAILSLLLEAGADPNPGTATEWTPLHEAMSCGFSDTSELLLRAGANFFARDDYRCSIPVEVVFRPRRKEMLEVIERLAREGVITPPEDEEEFINRQLLESISRGELERISVWLALNADVNQRLARRDFDAMQELVLQWEDDGEDLESCGNALLDAGANLRNHSSHGGTALHIAALNGRHAAARFLITRGADVNAKNSKNGHTPLHEAYGQNDDQMINILEAAGADPTLTNNDGKTPREYRGEGPQITLDWG